MAQHATTIMTMNDKKKDEDGECLIFELIPTCTDHFTNFKCRSRCTMAQWNQVYHKMPNTNQTSAKSAATRSSCQSGKEIFLSTRATVRSELQFSRKGEEEPWRSPYIVGHNPMPDIFGARTPAGAAERSETPTEVKCLRRCVPKVSTCPQFHRNAWGLLTGSDTPICCLYAVKHIQAWWLLRKVMYGFVSREGHIYPFDPSTWWLVGDAHSSHIPWETLIFKEDAPALEWQWFSCIIQLWSILSVIPSSVFCLSSLELSMQDKADVMWMRRPKFNLRRGAQRSIT